MKDKAFREATVLGFIFQLVGRIVLGVIRQQISPMVSFSYRSETIQSDLAEEEGVEPPRVLPLLFSRQFRLPMLTLPGRYFLERSRRKLLLKERPIT